MRWRRRSWRRLCLLAAWSAGSAAALAGCGQTLRYHSHVTSSGTDTYFALPSTWRVFGPTRVIKSIAPRMSPVQVRQVESSLWVMAFTASQSGPNPRFSLISNTLYGEVVARLLPASQSKAYNVSTLRSQLLNTDPVAAADAGSPFVRVLSSQGLSRAGMQGTKFVVDITAPGGSVYTVAQEGLWDSKSGWVYLIGIGCTERCFTAHRAVITSILHNWNVKEP